MRTLRAFMKIQWNITFLAFLLTVCCLIGCKSPTSPEEFRSHGQYRENVEVVYNRDTSRDCYTGYTGGVELRYILFDYSGQIFAPGEEYLYGGISRCNDVIMEVIGENKFRTYLKHVLISKEDSHLIFIFDRAFPHGITIDKENIKIEGAYDLGFFFAGSLDRPGTGIGFKMSEE